MWPAVRQIFPAWSAQFEGRVPWPYLDQSKDANGNPAPIVTTAIGNAMTSLGDFMRLPWRHKATGALCSPSEVEAGWEAVRACVDLAPQGGDVFQNVTDLRLTGDAIDALVDEALDGKEAELRLSFDLDEWPAAAQLVLFSMAWALGVGRLIREFPHFNAFMRAENFRGAATEAHIKETDNPGIVPRNVANARLLEEAAQVLEGGLELNVLHEQLGASASTPAMPSTPAAPSRPSNGGSGRGFLAGVLIVAVGAATYFATRSA
jgi:hypothetical protein